MMGLYERIRPLLFMFDPEYAHYLVMKIMSVPRFFPLLESLLLRLNYKLYDSLEQVICGITFNNPVGLAGGFDKDCERVRSMSALGFGYLELGSVTYDYQYGNPKPRIFRHVEELSIQNYVGLASSGARRVFQNLSSVYPFVIPIGINIGKNKLVPASDSIRNYESCLKVLSSLGDYYTFNLSSPNTPGIRELQNENFVSELLEMARTVTRKPLFIKISPDMGIDSMLRLCETAISSGVSGIIATNTTTDYSLLSSPKTKDGACFGGISGEAIRIKSRSILRSLSSAFFGKTVIISVGGIGDSAEAYERLKLGASLVQIYSSIVFKGPGIIKILNRDLDRMLADDGFTHISQAIGVSIK